MFIERPAAEIEPSLAMRSSSATLPGPSRPSWSKSMRMLRCGIAGLLTTLKRHTLDHGIDRPSRRQRQTLHRLGGEPRRQVGAVAIQPDVGLRAVGAGRDRHDTARQDVECADLLRWPEREA